MLGDIVRDIKKEVNKSKKELINTLEQTCINYTSKFGLKIKGISIQPLYEIGNLTPSSYSISVEIEGE